MKPTTNSNTRFEGKLIAPSFENVVLFRIQLRLTTGVGRDAKTDDKVYVKLNDREKEFYLIKGIDNFTEGHADTYDVLTEHIKKISDIQYLRFGVKGNDGVCLKKIELFFNNSTAPSFTKEYTGSGSCIDNDTAAMAKIITISGQELRSHAGWKFNRINEDLWRPPQRISKNWIVSLVEASIGNQIGQADDGTEWGSVGSSFDFRTIWGPAVEVNYVNEKTLHFDLDLQKILSYRPDAELDVDFDLEFNCENGIIQTKISNLKTRTNLYGTIVNYLAQKIASMVGKAVGDYDTATGVFVEGLLAKWLSFSLNFDATSPNVSASCKFTVVTRDCEILLR
jgi:hypothetical protein